MLYERMKWAKRFLELKYKYNSNLIKQHFRRTGARTVRFLQVSSGESTTNEAQFDPLWRHSALMCERLGLVACQVGIEEAMGLSPATLSRFDAIGLQFFFARRSSRFWE